MDRIDMEELIKYFTKLKQENYELFTCFLTILKENEKRVG